jgi:glutamate carboxypeptidase
VESFSEYTQAHLPDMLQDLKNQVEQESPSSDKEACDRCNDALARLLREYTGAEITWHEGGRWGKHFEAVQGSGPRRFLLLGHVDTVWPIGTLQGMPFHVQDDVISGPGIYDMKCGNIQALWALRFIAEHGMARDKTFTFLGTADEEVGSPTSRALIEECARTAEAVLVFEPAAGLEGGIKLRRKGIGRYTMGIKGVSSHAGADFAKGRSAIMEMTHQILDLSSAMDIGAGSTVNIGLISGGIAANVVAPVAEAEVDIRAWTMAEIQRVEARILARPTFIDGTMTEIKGSINRPPMEETPASRALYSTARELAHQEGFDVPLGESGGASDGNFTAALGISTLDGMGAVGGGAHAVTEHVRLSSIAKRTAWTARLLAML